MITIFMAKFVILIPKNTQYCVLHANGPVLILTKIDVLSSGVHDNDFCGEICDASTPTHLKAYRPSGIFHRNRLVNNQSLILASYDNKHNLETLKNPEGISSSIGET